MNKQRRVFILGAATALAGAGVGSFTTMAVKDRTYVPSDPYEPVGTPSREMAVVYYSRSGHSEAVAREVARTFNAPIARITADYELGFLGQGKAVSDANAGALPRIDVEPIDLRPARRVFLVSPTWMFRPATPLWAYVEQTDLSDKEIVLVTTGNSRFKQVEIDAFAKRVGAHGGRLVHHAFLRRGRIYWQVSREDLLDRLHTELRALRQG
ncbi:MAG: flavodoxin/nitric oxide synthase [Brevundimonas sp.]|nr:MAG: flavodoxin/nitric oxide synthase [Brevundimonas sp.]